MIIFQLQKEASEKGIKKEEVDLLVDQRVRSTFHKQYLCDRIDVRDECQKEVVSLQSQLTAKDDLLRQYSV